MHARVACAGLVGATVLSLAVGLSLSKRFSEVSRRHVVAGTPRDAAFAVAWAVVYAVVLFGALLSAYDARSGHERTAGLLGLALFLTALWPPLFVQDTPAFLGVSALVLTVAACVALDVATQALPRHRGSRGLWFGAGLLAGWLLVATTLNVAYISPAWTESAIAVPAVIGAIMAVLSGNPAIALPILWANAMTPMDASVVVCVGVSALAVVFSTVRLVSLYRSDAVTPGALAKQAASG